MKKIIAIFTITLFSISQLCLPLEASFSQDSSPTSLQAYNLGSFQNTKLAPNNTAFTLRVAKDSNPSSSIEEESPSFFIPVNHSLNLLIRFLDSLFQFMSTPFGTVFDVFLFLFISVFFANASTANFSTLDPDAFSEGIEKTIETNNKVVMDTLSNPNQTTAFQREGTKIDSSLYVPMEELFGDTVIFRGLTTEESQVLNIQSTGYDQVRELEMDAADYSDALMLTAVPDFYSFKTLDSFFVWKRIYLNPDEFAVHGDYLDEYGWVSYDSIYQHPALEVYEASQITYEMMYNVFKDSIDAQGLSGIGTGLPNDLGYVQNTSNVSYPAYPEELPTDNSNILQIHGYYVGNATFYAQRMLGFYDPRLRFFPMNVHPASYINRLFWSNPNFNENYIFSMSSSYGANFIGAQQVQNMVNNRDIYFVNAAGNGDYTISYGAIKEALNTGRAWLDDETGFYYCASYSDGALKSGRMADVMVADFLWVDVAGNEKKVSGTSTIAPWVASEARKQIYDIGMKYFGEPLHPMDHHRLAKFTANPIFTPNYWNINSELLLEEDVITIKGAEYIRTDFFNQYTGAGMLNQGGGQKEGILGNRKGMRETIINFGLHYPIVSTPSHEREAVVSRDDNTFEFYVEPENEFFKPLEATVFFEALNGEVIDSIPLSDLGAEFHFIDRSGIDFPYLIKNGFMKLRLHAVYESKTTGNNEAFEHTSLLFIAPRLNVSSETTDSYLGSPAKIRGTSEFSDPIWVDARIVGTEEWVPVVTEESPLVGPYEVDSNQGLPPILFKIPSSLLEGRFENDVELRFNSPTTLSNGTEVLENFYYTVTALNVEEDTLRQQAFAPLKTAAGEYYYTKVTGLNESSELAIGSFHENSNTNGETSMGTFFDANIGANIILQYSSLGFGGLQNGSVRINYNTGYNSPSYAGVFIDNLDDLDFEAFTDFSFSFRQESGINLATMHRIEIKDYDGNVYGLNFETHVGSVDSWKTVSIPILDIGNQVNLDNLKEIVFLIESDGISGKEGFLYLDNIQLSSDIDTEISLSVVYDDPVDIDTTNELVLFGPDVLSESSDSSIFFHAARPIPYQDNLLWVHELYPGTDQAVTVISLTNSDMTELISQSVPFPFSLPTEKHLGLELTDQIYLTPKAPLLVNDVLIFNTNQGATIGVDLFTMNIAWQTNPSIEVPSFQYPSPKIVSAYDESFILGLSEGKPTKINLKGETVFVLGDDISPDVVVAEVDAASKGVETITYNNGIIQIYDAEGILLKNWPIGELQVEMGSSPYVVDPTNPATGDVHVDLAVADLANNGESNYIILHANVYSKLPDGSKDMRTSDIILFDKDGNRVVSRHFQHPGEGYSSQTDMLIQDILGEGKPQVILLELGRTDDYGDKFTADNILILSLEGNTLERKLNEKPFSEMSDLHGSRGSYFSAGYFNPMTGRYHFDLGSYFDPYDPSSLLAVPSMSGDFSVPVQVNESFQNFLDFGYYGLFLPDGYETPNESDELSLNVFPTPFTEIFFIQFSEEAPQGSAQVHIYSSSGQLIQSQEIQVDSTASQIEISPSDNLLDGTYFLTITYSDGKTFHGTKIMKMGAYMASMPWIGSSLENTAVIEIANGRVRSTSPSLSGISVESTSPCLKAA